MCGCNYERRASVTGGAVVGSLASNKEDEWSDIDLPFGIKSGIEVTHILQEWTEALKSDFSVIDFFDIKFDTAVYRVLLFSNGLELDLSVVPELDYGATHQTSDYCLVNQINRKFALMRMFKL